MRGLSMNYQLTIPAIARRAEQLHRRKPVVARQADRSIVRTTYGEVLQRSRRLIGALRALGVKRGDRVATFCWNHQQHLEVYYGVPAMGAVVHTLNIRLHPDELAYIANHAGDSVAIVDRVLLSQFEEFRARTGVKHVIVVGGGTDLPRGAHDYETIIAESTEVDFLDDLDENSAAAMCYTSGTTGRAKGVVYSHRALALHAMALGLYDIEFVRERDSILAAVPMFHANAWGLPHAALLFGATQVMPGPFLDALSLLELIERERVTVFAGIPTIANGILQALDAAPGRHDVSSIRVLVCGGAPVPEAMIRAFDQRYGIRVVQGWGMTETAPLGSMSTLAASADDASADERYRLRASQGRPVPFIETRARNENGLVPWDGATLGELEVRGPWVSKGYYEAPESADRFTADGWFRTGDIVSIDGNGYVFIRDREKDLIKSGGEWVCSVALENAIMSHPAVLEAAVIGLRHPRWDERPLALVVTRDGTGCGAEEILSHLAPSFPKFWLPSAVEFVPALAKTSVGKFDKKAMRDQYQGYFVDKTLRIGELE